MKTKTLGTIMPCKKQAGKKRKKKKENLIKTLEI
jgi:hypothetical protein